MKNTLPMSDLEQFRCHSPVSAQDVYDLMKGSVTRLEKQMIDNANTIMRINDLIQNIKASTQFLPPMQTEDQPKAATLAFRRG